MNRIAVLLSILSCCGPAARASFDSDIEEIASQMAESLRLAKSQKLMITTIDEDRCYTLSMAPVYKALRKKLAAYAGKVIFTPFRGEENAIIRWMVKTGGAEYAPFIIDERAVDSLVMTGAYYLFDGDPDRVNFILKVVNTQGQCLFESNEYEVKRSDSPPSLMREVFSHMDGDGAFGKLLYRGFVIGKLDKLFNTAHNNLLTHPAAYRFEQRNPYLVKWQVDIVRELLALKYGICYSDNSREMVIAGNDGELAMVHAGVTRHVEGVFDIEPILERNLPHEKNTFHYIHPGTNAGTATVETRIYGTPGERLIRDQINEIFERKYPRLFSPLQIDALRSLFADNGYPSILVGRVIASDPVTGREEVAYTWHTPETWLDGLLDASESRGRRFDISASVIGIFGDNLDTRRFWAIVLQQWRTNDSRGNVIYSDNGFLLVNFDFDAGARLREFKIHYRLWFNEYRYDDREIGVKRHEKLIRDIDTYFIGGIGGIDSALKTAMREFLVEKIRSKNMAFPDSEIISEY